MPLTYIYACIHTYMHAYIQVNLSKGVKLIAI